MKKAKTGILTLLIGSSFLLTSCKCDKNAVVQDSAATDTEQVDTSLATSRLDAEGNYIYDIGNNIEIALPDGSKMSVGENSTENKLFGMLNDANFKVSDDKTQGWVTLDRVYFSTGKAELTANSEEQVDNIITLLKAF